MAKRPEEKQAVDHGRRLAIAAGAGGLVWTGLIGRFAQLQLAKGRDYQDLAEENRVRLDLAPPERGEIIDRFGKPLASHRQAGRVTLVREQVGDVRATLRQIAKLIDLPPARQERIAREAVRQAPFVETLVARELTYEDFARMKLHAVELPGVAVEMGRTRSYPSGRDFAHMLGYVAKASQRDLVRLISAVVRDRLDPQQRQWLDAQGFDGSLHPAVIERRLPEDSEIRTSWRETRQRLNRLYQHPDMRIGRSGIERVCDSWLTGTPGSRRVVTNAAGRIINELDSSDLSPQSGRDVVISVDSRLQKAAIERFGKESGAAVVLDAETGDILALVSTPAFDPNSFVNGISQADYDELRGNDRSPLYHKAFDGIYPPGSTFKMVVATAALEAGVIDPDERVYCPGHYRFGNRTWHCWKRGGHGAMNMHEAIKQSCDTYFYEVSKRTGVEKIAEVSHRFGFGDSWALGMTGGAEGVVPDDAWKRQALGEPWYEGETLNYGIGQGYLTATPLQLALMTARIATEGRFVEPNLLVVGPAIEGEPHPAPQFEREILQRMKEAMFAVTSEWGGTARRAGELGVAGARMAGKTGTAQVRRISAEERASGVIANEDLERRLRDHALFVGYAPAEDPKYAVSVIVEHGGSGSRAAAPVARDIMAEALRLDSRRAPYVQRMAGRSAGAAPAKGAP
ncbi:MAG: penicillin-binding protein 2 [Alphaproteobacteria bacterium]|jgi:penicillin-binding protein 2|nr:penicillin-binding protein 2 [Alphaproteobacteria bacterium]